VAGDFPDAFPAATIQLSVAPKLITTAACISHLRDALAPKRTEGDKKILTQSGEGAKRIGLAHLEALRESWNGRYAYRLFLRIRLAKPS